MKVELQPHQELLMDEMAELTKKAAILTAFLGEQPTNASAEEEPLLWVQLEIMKSYLMVLVQRVNTWEVEI